jgi:predicted Zn-dependent protease with MMP-like domain
MDKENFELAVKKAISTLPALLRKKLDNIEIVIEDEPIREKNLLGLYQGVPLKHRSIWYGNVLPDKITIFKQNIERIAGNDNDIQRIVKDVVFHEIGHHFGFDEDELRNITPD